MSLILDSSTTLAWVYSDETTTSIRQVFDLLISKQAWVPTHWPLEVANVLEMGARRGRHDAAFKNATLTDLALLPIHIDPETPRHAWELSLHLAERHRLTLYDAAYLELALRKKFPLATLDRELRIAAQAEGVPLLGM